MDDISQEFNLSKPPSHRAPNPKLVDLVKFLARVSAEREYNKAIQDIISSEGGHA